MKFHHAQHNLDALKKIGDIFQGKMLERGILPVNPWKAKRVHKWLASMGARMKPGSRHYDSYRGREDCSNFLNFKVECHRRKERVKGFPPGYKMGESCFMRIEIPWELADKVLTLGYLP